MSANRPRSLKRAALRAFVASIVLSALLGIWALLAGNFGHLQVKVLLSSLSVSAASLAAMGGAALFESRGERPLPFATVGLAGLALLLLLAGIWGELDEESFWKPAVTVCIAAVACSHVSLLRLARLARRHAWLRWAAPASVFGLALWGAGMLWAEADEDLHFRLLGVLSILAAAATLATPVLHRLGRDDLAAAARPPVAGGAVDMLCPACGARFASPLGDVACPRCAARFRLELREPAPRA